MRKNGAGKYEIFEIFLNGIMRNEKQKYRHWILTICHLLWQFDNSYFKDYLKKN